LRLVTDTAWTVMLLLLHFLHTIITHPLRLFQHYTIYLQGFLGDFTHFGQIQNILPPTSLA